jgi:hypothetical protein
MINPDITQKQKRETLENDRLVRQASTYFHHAQSIDLELSGRYSKLTPTSVTGSTPGPIYPQQSETSPANQAALTGPEAPLGYDINAIDPVGERWEQEASKSTIESFDSTKAKPTAVERAKALAERQRKLFADKLRRL